MAEIMEYIGTVKDFRDEMRVTYKLGEILLLVFFFPLADADRWEEIWDFGVENLAVLKKYLPYTDGIPSLNRIRTFMGTLDLDVTEQMLLRWNKIRETEEGGRILRSLDLEETKSDPDGQEGIRPHISLDGKTMRGNHAAGQRPLHILSAYEVLEEKLMGQVFLSTGTAMKRPLFPKSWNTFTFQGRS